MSKLRVLVAGGSDLINSVLKTSLMCWGYEVITVDDGEQACVALCVGNIDVCILATKVPRTSGLEVCRFIRQSDIKAQPVIILLTQTVSTDLMRAAYLAGANDFVTTPLSLRDIKYRISGIAGRLSEVHSQSQAFQRLDPIERYRQDLSLHADVHASRIHGNRWQVR
jgi:two-component system, sensor histidine kinase ChiS